ncbi:hypothetical protein AB0K00_19690 [Dactylosporangium sp. NPDC049525]
MRRVGTDRQRRFTHLEDGMSNDRQQAGTLADRHGAARRYTGQGKRP